MIFPNFLSHEAKVIFLKPSEHVAKLSGSQHLVTFCGPSKEASRLKEIKVVTPAATVAASVDAVGLDASR